MFSFILFRRNINYLLPRLLNIWKPDILPRIINCYDVHAYMPQHQYLASYVYIITVYISLYNILKDKISNLTTYTVKPAVAVTSIKRDPPLSGHFRVPRTILNANAPLLSVHLSNAASGRRNLPQNAEIVSVSGHFPWFDAAV